MYKEVTANPEHVAVMALEHPDEDLVQCCKVFVKTSCSFLSLLCEG